MLDLVGKRVLVVRSVLLLQLFSVTCPLAPCEKLTVWIELSALDDIAAAKMKLAGVEEESGFIVYFGSTEEG